MENILIAVILFSIAGGVVYYLTRKGKIADRDGDGIPNVVEDAAAKVVEEVVEKKREVKQAARKAKSTVKSTVSKAKSTAKSTASKAKATAKKVTKGSRKSNSSKSK